MFGAAQVIKIVSILIIVLIFAGGAWYVTGIRADLATSQANSERLLEAVQQQQEALENVRKEQAQIREMNASLSKQVAAQLKDMSDLQDRFSVDAKGNARDLGKKAIQEPAKIETVINNASNKALRCLELASGDTVKEGETNEECPSLVTVNK